MLCTRWASSDFLPMSRCSTPSLYLACSREQLRSEACCAGVGWLQQPATRQLIPATRRQAAQPSPPDAHLDGLHISAVRQGYHPLYELAGALHAVPLDATSLLFFVRCILLLHRQSQGMAVHIDLQVESREQVWQQKSSCAGRQWHHAACRLAYRHLAAGALARQTFSNKEQARMQQLSKEAASSILSSIFVTMAAGPEQVLQPCLGGVASLQQGSTHKAAASRPAEKQGHPP